VRTTFTSSFYSKSCFAFKGDFALYLNCGVSKAKALALNFAAACCCYVGMFIGIAVSSDDAFRPWITAFIAGVFVYISFVDVVSTGFHGVEASPELVRKTYCSWVQDRDINDDHCIARNK